MQSIRDSRRDEKNHMEGMLGDGSSKKKTFYFSGDGQRRGVLRNKGG